MRILIVVVLCLFPSTAFAALASWYGPELHGRRTASGERFNMNAMTAAHRTLPFGTRVQVCRSRCVVVRINDRGPARWTGKSIDLSRAAARAVGLPGVGHVRLAVVR